MSKTRSIVIMAFAMIANIAFSQNLKVTSNGTPVSNNDVIEIPYVFEDYSVPELGMYYYLYTWDPHLEASTVNEDANLYVELTSIDNTVGFQLCWPGGCQALEPGKTVSSTGKISTVPSDLQIHKEFSSDKADETPTEGGTIKVTLKCGSEIMELTVKAILADNRVGENVADSNVAPEYYTIQGIRINEPQKGQLLIERKGNKVTKRIF